jgi:hypothetical protein
MLAQIQKKRKKRRKKKRAARALVVFSALCNLLALFPTVVLFDMAYMVATSVMQT